MKNNLAQDLNDQDTGTDSEDSPAAASSQQTDSPPPSSQDPTATASPQASTPQTPATPFDIPPPPPPPPAQDFHNEDLAQYQDAASRQITPQTCASMFADKSTLGKIGSLFGLMLSGAGSGLAHQPNMVMDMMNNQIKNDLDSQKSNVSNAQNFLTLSYQHQLQQAQIRNSAWNNLRSYAGLHEAAANIQAQQAAIGQTKAGTQKIMGEVGMQPQQAALLKVQTDAETARKNLEISQQNLAVAGTASAQEDVKQKSIANQKAQMKLDAMKGTLSPQQGVSQTPQQPGSSPTSASDPGVQTFPTPYDVKQASIIAPAQAANGMRIAVLQKLQDDTASNPQGQAVLNNSVIPAVAAANMQSNNEAAQKLQDHQAQHAALYADPINDPASYDKLVKNGQIFSDDPSSYGFLPPVGPSHFGAISPGDSSKIDTERAALKGNRQLYAEAAEVNREIALLPNKGQVGLGTDIIGRSAGALGALAGAVMGAVGSGGTAGGGVAGAAAGNALGTAGGGGLGGYRAMVERHRDVLAAHLKSVLGDDVANSILPNRFDKPASDPKMEWEMMNKIFSQRDATLAPTIDHYGLKSDFPALPYEEAPTDLNSIFNPKQLDIINQSNRQTT